MGYEWRTITISTNLDLHGGEKERLHDKRFAELEAEIKAVCERYTDISAWVI